MRTLAEIVRLRTNACREAVDAVAMIAAGEEGVDRRAAAHVGACLRCQAEVAAYRRVLATMRSMRADVLPVPARALSEALEAVHGPAGSAGSSVAGAGSAGSAGSSGEGTPAWAVRAAYVGGITAASAAGMFVWLSRRRLGLPHAS